MKFSVLTLFPEQITYNMSQSISGRALNKAVYELECVNIRDFADNDYGRIDDTLYGGGQGMLIQAEPLYRAYSSLKPAGPKSKSYYLSPKGRVFDQDLAVELAELDQLTLICGHYEGVDQRFLDACAIEELSLGSFVISGGELAAVIVMDAIVRLLPGTFTSSEAFEEESFYKHILECRHYTKPPLWMDRAVPEVLLSGNHALIERWRYLDGLRETMLKRPDLFDAADLCMEDYAALLEHMQQYE